MTEYATDTRRLVIKGFPTADADTRRAVELRHFIKGLNDPQMALAVGMKNPTNIDEAREAVDTYLSLRDEMGKMPARVRAVHTVTDDSTEQESGEQETSISTAMVTQQQLKELMNSLDNRFRGLSKLLKEGARKQPSSVTHEVPISF